MVKIPEIAWQPDANSLSSKIYLRVMENEQDKQFATFQDVGCWIDEIAGEIEDLIISRLNSLAANEETSRILTYLWVVNCILLHFLSN